MHTRVRWRTVPKRGTIVPNMGTKRTSGRSSISSALFSAVQGRVLALLFGQPERRFQSAELIRLVGGGTGATLRTLQQLAAADLVTVTAVGNQRYYRANEASPVFLDLCRLVLKSAALAEPLQRALAPLASRIAEAFVFGSTARQADAASSDIDLLVVSDDVEYAELYERLLIAERAVGRRIEPTLLTEEAWSRKQRARDGFATRVAKSERIPIITRLPDDPR